MARISADELDRLKTDIAVQRLVEAAGIELKRSGKDWLGRCPFHADGEPSLVVTPTKNLWHCFGCSAAGGPIDWVMKLRGVSFRHAVELLKADPAAAAGSSEPVRRGTVRVLAAPVALDTDDQALLNQVIDYYHETLKTSPEAQAYLDKRGLAHAELIARFKLGYANRTLGLRLPAKNRMAGAEMRRRLEKLGIYRTSGHEHFNGSLVVPVIDEAGNVREVYGRKLRDDLRVGTPKHLYLPGPHAGVWNSVALNQSEVIVCESLIDAMTFWCVGLRNVTSTYGIEGVTDELLDTLQAKGVERVLIAFDRDEAGERGAEKFAQRAQGLGIEAWRIGFPKGMDANEYAIKVQPANKSLGLLVRQAQWLGNGTAPKRAALELDEVANCDLKAGRTNPEPSVPVSTFPLAAADVSDTPAPLPAAAVPAAPQDVAAQVSETEVVLVFGEAGHERRWRVRGLPKNLAVGVLKVNLMVGHAENFYVDTLDLYAARARATFVQQAALELRLGEEVLKSELGRVLLKLEQWQDEAIARAHTPAPPTVPEMSESEREAALALLKSPELLARILADFDAAGVVGEATNKLVGYLAATSRLLPNPLAVVLQSSSAAGKSALMDAVLSLMPAEETMRYSALTGQSLYYLGETNLKHKVLAISEEEGAHRAAYALKLLQSEGELTIASTGSDANGNLVTQQYRVEGPMTLFMTTTAIDIDEELLNRCLVLSVDEGRAQTQAIHQRQRTRRTLAGLAGRVERDAVRDLHRNAQRLLRGLAVVNPYADRLTFLDDRTRTRRDHEKYLTLIDTIALLHQHQRPVRTLTAGDRTIEYIEVTTTDIEAANGLAHEVLGRSLDELPPQTRKLLTELTRWVASRMQLEHLTRSAVRFTRRVLREALGWGDTQLKVHLARLTELELVLAHRQPGGSVAYELVYDGDGSAVPHLSGLIEAGALHYDGARSGVNDTRSAPGRPPVGGVSGGGRDAKQAAERDGARVDAKSADAVPETRALRPNGAVASYPQVVPLAAHGR